MNGQSPTGVLVDAENMIEPTTLIKSHYWYLQSYVQDADGNTQLHHCMFHMSKCNYDIHAQQLINSTWPPSLLDIRNNDGMAALHVGVMGTATARIRQLLVAGANPMSKDNNGCIPLHYACISSSVPMIAALMRAFDAHEISKMQLKNLPIPDLSKTIDVRNIDGATPLHIATENGRLEVMYVLLSLGATIDSLRYVDGRRPLEIAILKRHRHITEFLLSYYQKNPDDLMPNQYCCPDLIGPLKEMGLEDKFIKILKIPVYRLYQQGFSDNK